jgi:transposase
VLLGESKRIPCANPRGRWVNARAAWNPCWPERSLWWDAVARTLRLEDLLLVLDAIPRGDGELAVVLDNASLQRSHVVQEAQLALEPRGIRLYYVPTCSPELHAIEPLFEVIGSRSCPRAATRASRCCCMPSIVAFGHSETRLLERSLQQLRQQLSHRRPALSTTQPDLNLFATLSQSVEISLRKGCGITLVGGAWLGPHERLIGN